MQIHKIIQGTPEFHQFRLVHNGASEAAPMLGLSKKVSRTQLLNMKFTSIPKQFSDWVQENILDKGHELEAKARPIIERLIDDDLYPVICSDGKLSASCDGLTLDRSTAWEHKQFNRELIESVNNNVLPDEHWPQCQQVLMVTGAKQLIFTVSDGTEEHMASMTVYPDQALFGVLRAGWAQFENDLATYVPVQIDEKPEAKAVLELPALVLHAEGRLTNSNLSAFQAALAEHLKETRALVYVTDEDFSNASAVAKMYRETCKKLELAKEAMLSQTATIGEAARQIDVCHEDLRVTALQIEKDVAKNTDLKKQNIINEAKIGFTAFIAELEKIIAPIRLIYTVPNFAEAIKGKRLFSAMHDAVQTMLANTKIEYNATATGIRSNLDWLNQHSDYMFLFNDLQNIVYKQADDFQLLINSRIAEHKRLEAVKLEEARQKAIDEERARVEAAAAIEAAKVKEAEEQRQRADAAKLLAEKIEQNPIKTHDDHLEPVIAKTLNFDVQQEAIKEFQQHPASTPPTLRLGQIGERLGFTITAELLRHLGFEGTKDKNATLFHEHQFRAICMALVNHIGTVYEQHQQAA